MFRPNRTALALSLFASLAGAQETVERHLTAMGTHLSIEVTAPSRSDALAASEAAVRAIAAVEDRLSTWDAESELSRLNRASVGEPFELSAELASDLTFAREAWSATDGTFDPGVGALAMAWGLREGGRLPTDQELADALAGGGFASLALQGSRATRMRDGLLLDAGGFGKGVGLDAALAALRGTDATGATVDLGGQVVHFSQDEALARFAVADPRDRAATVIDITMESGSLATSGNSERGIRVGGESASHLLDPRTGRPAEDFGSVTVWASNAAWADALSTALYVMGPEAGLTWAANEPGVEALFLVVEEGGALTARATAPFVARLNSTLPGLAIEPADDPLAQWAVGVGAAMAGAAPAPEPAPKQQADGDVEERLSRLEQLSDAFSYELERFSLGDVVPPVGDSYSGLGPAASKIYSKDQGLSIGGYGETLSQFFDGDSDDTFDFLRAIFYFGYKFNDNWVLNVEIEHEHADETFVEFAYMDYISGGNVNGRGGLVLIPMGFINELHEPTTFLSATRPDTETKIIPSTWRENGAGVYGDAGPFEYRSYIVNGLDGSGFSAGGLRGGRQKGSQTLANDLAFVARADYVDIPGLRLGGSFYMGDSGQDIAGIGSVGTTIYELHGEYRQGGLWVRALAAVAELDDVAELNAGLGLTGSESVGERLEGWYGEIGYDIMQIIDPELGVEVSPYVRFEAIDTQAEVPTGFTSNPANDEEITTIGIRWLPMNQIVFKAESQSRDQGDDSINFGMGYIF